MTSEEEKFVKTIETMGVLEMLSLVLVKPHYLTDPDFSPLGFAMKDRIRELLDELEEE